MASINTFQLESVISNDLRDHGYYPWISTRMKKTNVSETEIFNSLLNPATSIYISERIGGDIKTVFQVNASLVNMMFYAIYSGYLYAYILDDEKYDQNVWTYSYMHKTLGGHIYEPIFISLLPQLLDYTVPDELRNLYSKDSVKVYNIIYRWIYSFVKTYNLDEGNLYDDYDKDSDFYKETLPNSLKTLHDFGTSIFYAQKYDKENRLYGKFIISENLKTDLNDI